MIFVFLILAFAIGAFLNPWLIEHYGNNVAYTVTVVIGLLLFNIYRYLKKCLK